MTPGHQWTEAEWTDIVLKARQYKLLASRAHQNRMHILFSSRPPGKSITSFGAEGAMARIVHQLHTYAAMAEGTCHV